MPTFLKFHCDFGGGIFREAQGVGDEEHLVQGSLSQESAPSTMLCSFSSPLDF